MENPKLVISSATSNDIDVIYDFIHEMAVYEKCEEDFVTDKDTLYTSLFEEKAVECLLLREEGNDRVIGFTVFFIFID